MRIKDFNFKRREGYVRVADADGELAPTELSRVPSRPKACEYISQNLVDLILNGNCVLYQLDQVIKSLERPNDFNSITLDAVEETRSAFAAEFWDRVKTEIRTIKRGKHDNDEKKATSL